VDNKIPSVFRVSSLCHGKPLWIGSLESVAKGPQSQLWSLQIPLVSWTSHFGVGVSIFHPQLKCELEVSLQNRLLKMTCPIYARNRSPEQFVELTQFSFEKKGRPTMKIEGYVKQPPELISKIESVVPLEGDIRVKETVYPRKQEELEKLEFNHTQKGDPHGQKEKSDKEKKPEENTRSEEESQREKESESQPQEEGESERDENEAPPIKPSAPPATR
jgi:hypothetical protein